MPHCQLKETEYLHIEYNENKKPSQNWYGQQWEYNNALSEWTKSVKVYKIAEADIQAFVDVITSYGETYEHIRATKPIIQGIDFDWEMCEVYTNTNKWPMDMVRLKPAMDECKKMYTLEDMRDFAKKCCLLWNEENNISYAELVDEQIEILKQK